MKIITSSKKMEKVHSDIRGDLFLLAMELEKNGRKILKLNTGNPATFGFKMPKSISDALTGREHLGLGYCDFRGMPESREAIAAYHRSKGIRNIDADDVFIGNGVSEVVTFALESLLDPGDEVLVPTPCYSLWSNSVHITGATPVFYTCDESSEWFPDCRDMERKITPKTKAIVLINPNNPTGALYPESVLTEIIRMAKEHGLIIFSDEIYDRLVMDGKEHVSIASLTDEVTVVTMNGLSKSHSLCGFRVGWMVISGPRELSRDYRSGIVKLTSMRLCANALSQIVIPAALADSETPASMVRPGGRIYEQREATVRELARIDSISFVKNSAAFYVFPRLDTKKLGITNDKQFAKDLLYATNILIVPGSGFEWEAPDHFRIVMLPEKEILSDAASRMGEFLDTYHSK